MFANCEGATDEDWQKVVDNMGLVYHYLNRMGGFFTDRDREDAEQDGIFGLLRAAEGPCAVTEVRRPVNRSRPQLDVGRGGRGWQLRGRLGAHNQTFSDLGVTLRFGNRARGDRGVVSTADGPC